MAIKPFLVAPQPGCRRPQGTPDAYLVPGVCHAQAVATEDVDAVLLAHRADLARVVHRHLLGDDEDLVEVRIDPDQLGDAVACGRGRQVDDAAVEAVAGIQAFAHVVVDRDRCRAASPAPGRFGRARCRTRRCRRSTRAPPASHRLDSPPRMFSTQTRSSTGRDLRQRVDADVVLEVANTLLEHV